MASIPLSEAVRIFLDWCENNRSAGTTEQYRIQLHKFAQSCPVANVSEIMPIHILAFSSRWHPLQAVKRWCSWLHSVAKVIAEDPGKTVRLPRQGRRERVLTPTESARLLRAAARSYRNFLVAMRESVARPKEVRDCRVCDIRTEDGSHFDAASLREGRCLMLLPDWKTKGRSKADRRYREIPISPRLGRLILRLIRKNPDPQQLVFRTRRGKPWTKDAIVHAMQATRIRAGIDVDSDGEGIVAYSLRHTGATRLVRQGVNLKVVSRTLGHEQVKTTERYIHVDRADLTEVTRKHRMNR